MTSTCRGVDVSAYQAAQDWAKHKADGLVFAFAKASEGQKSRDSRFATHIKGIQAAGLVPGAYHFGWPNQDPAVEAANYIAAVKPYAGKGFCHWLDLERYSDGRNYKGRTAAQIKAWCAAWIAAVQKAFPGQRVGIYTSADDIAYGHVPADVPLWYPAYPWGAAAYAKAEAAARPRPSGRAVTFWQFTSTPLDRSICYMSAADLRAWAQGTGKPSTPACPPFPGRDKFVLGAHGDFALQLQQWLDKGKWGPAYKVGPSRTMTQLDLDKVAALQRHYLKDLGPADGLTGPKTWLYAWQVANGLRKK
ncbi:GH25 family lysozyme [Streptomyces sp. NPDC056309]|uniref:GH25 family lysozyme n=1 Tax=Streptomyces sp. NPDC056309 TaxID=3345781 RepID=UPI0035D6581F